MSTNLENLENKIITKARENPQFKQQLLTNPKQVFEQELGQQLPNDIEVEVLQQTPHKLYIVLPMSIDELAQAYLSEEELEAVSGGTNPVVGWAVASGLTAGVNAVLNLTHAYRCFL
jgi:hypothetical protein